MSRNETNLTTLERMRVQMQEVVPLIRDLEEILGRDVVHAALERRNRLREERARARPRDAGNPAAVARGIGSFAAGDALTYEVKESTEQRSEIHVTRCGYREMMHDLDALDLGPLLICERDYELAEHWGLKLERTQTCMKGASHCDFVYTPLHRIEAPDGAGDPHEDR